MSEVTLARQLDFVFRQLEPELIGAVAGTVLIHVRNNTVGKFGIKHHPIEIKEEQISSIGSGMSKENIQQFRSLAIDALQYKTNWTHGEILYDFAVKSKPHSWSASVLYESNYNMANWNYVPYIRKKNIVDYSS